MDLVYREIDPNTGTLEERRDSRRIWPTNLCAGVLLPDDCYRMSAPVYGVQC